MASFDWQTPLYTTYGLVAAPVARLLTGLYWVAKWIVLRVVANAPRYIVSTASVLATPLTYPLYYIWRAVAFLLSPLWALWRMAVGFAGLIVGLIVKFKFAIAGLVGILSACMMYGTSNIIFSVLGISPSSRSETRQRRLRIQTVGYSDQDNRPALKEEEDYEETSSSSTELESLLSEPGNSRHRNDRPAVSVLEDSIHPASKPSGHAAVPRSDQLTNILTDDKQTARAGLSTRKEYTDEPH